MVVSDYVVGISGGIGSGKTTVTDLFAKYTVDVIDADVIAREVVEPGTAALKAIVAKFGDSVLDESGGLDRAKLYEQVDRVVIVDVDEQTQLQRTLLRDKTNAPQIRAIMSAQASRQQRLAVADDVIDNNGKTDDLAKQVAHLHKRYLQLAKQNTKSN